MALKKKLGLAAVSAIVVGDMIGSGIFFTPGQLAAVAEADWQVYLIWAMCGFIALCGALTLAELAVLIPQAGVPYRALSEAYGSFAGFMQAWVMVLVSGPGAIAGIAILFGEFADRIFGAGDAPLAWAVGAIVFFAAVNLRGVSWGGRTQILLTGVKVLGLLALIVGGILVADAAPVTAGGSVTTGGLPGFFQFVGLGVAIVLFTYDGWIDASNIAGEVRNPGATFPRALGFGVVVITVLYLLVNVAFLRVVPLEAMRADPEGVAATVAIAAFGSVGGMLLNLLMWISIFGALGGLVMTLPRLFYAAANDYLDAASGTPAAPLFRGMATLSATRGVPAGAILFAALVSIAALVFFGSFSRIVSFFVVPFQLMNVLLIASIYRLRPRLSGPGDYRAPLYPWLPAIFIAVMLVFIVSAFVFNPLDALIGVVLTLAGAPVYLALTRRARGNA